MTSLEELILICDIETDKNGVGWRKRRDAVESWINKYVVESKSELSVVNPKVFSTDAMDFIKEKLIENASEDLTTHTKYGIKKNKITAKILILKE